MAGTISAQPVLKLVNGKLNDPGPNLGTIQVTQNTALLWKSVVTLVAGTDTDVGALIQNITTRGIAYFYNLDPTNYVQWGANNAGVMQLVGRLSKADIPAVFRLDNGGTLRMKANTGNCNVLCCVYDD